MIRHTRSLWANPKNDALLPWGVGDSSGFLRTLISNLIIALFSFFSNKHFEHMYLTGKVGLELVPQGTLVERLRAHAAGIPAFYTPTGSSTAVEKGAIPIKYKEGGPSAGIEEPGNANEVREFNGKKYVMEPALAGDVAFVRAWKADEAGNTIFRYESFYPSKEDPLTYI